MGLSKTWFSAISSCISKNRYNFCYILASLPLMFKPIWIPVSWSKLEAGIQARKFARNKPHLEPIACDRREKAF
jgi:hypothetical protein